MSPRLYKTGRDPLKMDVILYDSQYKPTDHRSRVLCRADGPNLSNSCVSIAFLFLITRISADQSTFMGYPSEDCRRYSVDNNRLIMSIGQRETKTIGQSFFIGHTRSTVYVHGSNYTML